MSGSLNKVTLIGNLGKDPEIRSLNNGKSVANFSIATKEAWKDKQSGEKKEKTEWHNIVVFSEGLVRVAQSYLKKGSKVYIEGQLQTRKWQDQSGNDRYSTEIVLQAFGGTLIMLDGKQDSKSQQGYTQQNYQAPIQQTQVPSFAAELDDDIPF